MLASERLVDKPADGFSRRGLILLALTPIENGAHQAWGMPGQRGATPAAGHTRDTSTG